MKKVGEIGWGMAILPHTYCQLGLTSRCGVRGITGCLTLVVAWICEHFVDLVRVQKNMEYTEMKPQMCKWKPQQCTDDQTTTTTSLRERIGDLIETDFDRVQTISTMPMIPTMKAM